MVVVASATLISYALYGMMQQLNRMNRDTTSQQIYQAAMISYMTYTRAAIKRRWCMTADWVQDMTCANNPDSALANPMNTERMILSPNEIGHIQALAAANPNFKVGTPITLSKIETYVDVTQLSPTHPIKQIASAHELSFLGKVHFTITPVPDAGLPRAGSENYLMIQVEFLPAPGKSLPDGRGQMIAWSKIVVYPREVGTFALVVPGDLHLDGTGGSILGDVSLPAGTSGAPGLLIDSPVFVNGNIWIPGGNATQYTPVTFTSQVILGTGILLQGGQPATTSQAGGYQGQTYSNIPGFGGFLSGISMDGERDLGLDMFDYKYSVAAPNLNFAQACEYRNLVMSDPSQTKSAELISNISGNQASADLSWTYEDYFRQQDINANASGQNLVQNPNIQFTSKNRKPVINVALNFNDTNGNAGTANIQMPFGATSTMMPQVPPPPPPANNGGGNGNNNKPPPPPKPPPTTVSIQTAPDLHDNVLQENRLNLSVAVANPPAQGMQFTMTVNGYDMSYDGGVSIRTDNSNFHPMITYQVSVDKKGNVQITSPSGSGWTDPSGTALAPCASNTAGNCIEADQLNWEDLTKSCQNNSNNPMAFQPEDWDVHFDMRTSWNLYNTRLPDGQNPIPTPGPPGACLTDACSYHASDSGIFQRASISKVCTINGDVQFLAGFFVCDQFNIAPRNAPLRLVGTVITNRLTIDPSAYVAGIHWSNIYMPNAVMDLRGVHGVPPQKILDVYQPGPPAPPNTDTCDIDPNFPIWGLDLATADPSIQAMKATDSFWCNSISLRNQFEPIQWTTVDPDGGPSDPANTSSPWAVHKFHPVRFIVEEYDRGFM